MIKNQENFCILPWIHLYAEPDGKVYPCCTASPFDGVTPVVGNLKENTLSEVYHSDQWNKLRKQMMNGERAEACTRCWQFDDAGGSSYRQHNNRVFEKFRHIVDETHDDGSIDDFHFKFINLRDSIECNFACLTCGPMWSTGWNKYNRIGKQITKGKTHLNDNSKVPIWDQVKEHLHTADSIYFTGGEPLMMPEHYKTLDYMIQNGLTDTRLIYNTNMSNLNLQKYNVLDKWKMFDRVEVGASIDAVGKRAEIIRWGTKWDEVEANLLSLKGYDNIHLGVDSVISLLNIDHVPTMQRHLEKVGIVDGSTIMSYNIAFGPDISITSLPDEIKQRMELYLLDHFNKYEGPLKHHMKWGYKQVINFMKEKNTWNRDKFKHLINYRYYFAKDDLLEHLPLVKEMYEHE